MLNNLFLLIILVSIQIHSFQYHIEYSIIQEYGHLAYQITGNFFNITPRWGYKFDKFALFDFCFARQQSYSQNSSYLSLCDTMVATYTFFCFGI